MPAEIGHELGQRLVIKAVEQLFDVRFLADIGEQPFAPRRSALIGQRRIIGVGAAIDPFLKAVAAGALESLPLPLAILARKSVVWGKRVSVRVDLGGRRIIKQKKQE